MKIALVYMPWGSIEEPSVSLSLLKSIAEQRGHEAKVFYLNLDWGYRFASPSKYERLSFGYGIGDWIFSEYYYGKFSPDGTTQDSFYDYLKTKGLTDGDFKDIEAVKARVPEFIEYCYEKVDWEEYDVIGFTTTFYQTLAAVSLARLIKERHPDKTIVFGGGNCDSDMGQGMHEAFPFVDYVVSGEADTSFPALLDALENKTGLDLIKGIRYREGGKSVFTGTAAPQHNLDALPTPDYSDFFASLNAIGIPSARKDLVWLESSRGCWWGAKFHCTFCGLNDDTIVGRDKSAERVIEEIKEVITRYPVTRIKFTDNILSKKHFKTLLPKIQELECDLFFFYETKANLKKEEVRALRDAGVRTVQAGIESLNTRKLQLMKKGVTGIQNVQLFKWAAEHSIYVYWNWLHGFPGEVDADVQQELETMQYVTHLYPPLATTPVMLERFSPYFNNPKEFNIEVHGPEEFYRYVYPLGDDVLTKMAYTFDYKSLDAELSPDGVTQVRDFISRWRENYRPQSLYFKRGIDCIYLYDRRFNVSPKQVKLKGERREIYLYCDQIRGLQQVTKHLEETFGKSYGDPAVRAILDELVELKLTYREGDRYLSLAVPFNQDYEIGVIAGSVIRESLSHEMTQG